MTRRTVLALSGGIGGAKLALGLARLLEREQLTVVANPGDDFEHLGLTICPDLDTLAYTLAGLADPERGWGRADETWSFMETLADLGGQTWFRLGDRDLALHVERTRRLRAGESLSSATAEFCARLGSGARILPASDQPVRTAVETAPGPLAFQEYFVRERCAPAVTGFRFLGAEAARPSPGFAAALADPELTAIVVCPSNPFISIDPILAIPGVAAGIAAAGAPVIAVSPIVGGEAVKGPTAKMLRELGLPVSAHAIARRYRERLRLDGFVLDEADAAQAREIEALGPAVLVAPTLMTDLPSKARLAGAVLEFAARLRPAEVH